jgi:DNA-binding NarL/FixJ family response regulator
LYREGLSELLAAERDLRIVGTVASMDELVALCDDARPDVAVLDWDSGGAAPRQAARHLRRRLPALRIIVLRDQPGTGGLGVAGAVVVARGEGMRPIVDAIRAVPPAGPAGPAGPKPAPAPVGSPTGPRLTPRERAVLALISAGYTSQEIAARLDISPKTVDNYKQRMFAKLAVQNQAHAVAVAIRRGMLMPQPFAASASAS